MNFENINQIFCCQGEKQINQLIEKIGRNKCLHPKFINDLNCKYPKNLNKKNHKEKQSKCNQQNEQLIQQNSQTSQNNNRKKQKNHGILKDKSQKKKNKQVKFRKNDVGQKQQRPSIEQNLEENFIRSISKIASLLMQSKKICPKQSVFNQSECLEDNSLCSGYAEKQFQDGTFFKGICQKGVIIKGQLRFKNNFIYNGQLFLNQFHGQGKLTLPKKQQIQADWVQGQIIGKAKITYPKGQVYYGELKNYKRHGQGFLFFTDGSKYEGQFSEGQLTGYGTHIKQNGQQTKGYWFYGQYVSNNEQQYEKILKDARIYKSIPEKQIELIQQDSIVLKDQEIRILDKSGSK